MRDTCVVTSTHWESLASALPAGLGGMIPFGPGRRIRAHLIQSKYEVLEKGIFAPAHRRGPSWFIAARPDSYSRMRPGSAVCGVLVRNGGRTPVGVDRVTMILDPPPLRARLRISESEMLAPLYQVPRWVSGADLPHTLGALSIGCWCVPTAEIVVRGAHHRVSFEVALDSGKVLRTSRVEVRRSRSR